MDEINRRALLGAAGMASVAALAGSAKAGPINPPAGAVVGTGRTVDEIYNKIPSGGAGDGRSAIPGGTSPVNIAQSGSYVLTGSIVANTTAVVIQINASDVVLDLNGFVVQNTVSVAGGGSSSALQVSTGQKRVVVRNGTVRGGAYTLTGGSSNVGLVLEDLIIDSGKFRGLLMGSSNAGTVVRRCTVTDTGSTSTAADTGLLIIGMDAGDGARVEDCSVVRTVNNSTSAGPVRGIVATTGVGTIISRCHVYNAVSIVGSTGISVAAGSVYRDNFVVNFATKYTGAGTDAGGNQ